MSLYHRATRHRQDGTTDAGPTIALAKETAMSTARAVSECLKRRQAQGKMAVLSWRRPAQYHQKATA